MCAREKKVILVLLEISITSFPKQQQQSRYNKRGHV